VRGTARQVLSVLTGRGRWLVGGGAALLLVGALMGERSLVHMAVFVLALPVLAAATVVRERFRLTVRRTVTPARVPRGGSADVLLEITNADGRPGGLWALTEQVPPELDRSPQFVVERLAGGATTRLPYRVGGNHRGRHVLGPLRLTLMDPFGLVERSAVGTDTAQLIVVPRVRPLGPSGPAGGQGGGGEGDRRTIAVHGEDDVSVREYRHGDDLRKVHWRATARTGELMVRLEERPWRAQATLLLDARSRAHLVTPRLPVPGSAEPVAVGPSRVPTLATGVEQLCRAAGDGPVICLLGAVGPDDVSQLVRARSGPTTDLAILVDIESWARAGLARGRRALSPASLATLTRQREDATTLLRAGGWRVASARADQSVAEVWAALGAPVLSPAAADRASLGAPA
jgi:uncharacterized protein (DUF58 family)